MISEFIRGSILSGLVLATLTPVSADKGHRPSAMAMQAFNQGVQRFNARQYQEAVPFFDQAIEHDAEFAEAYYGRGSCHYYQKNIDAALSDLNEALRINPDFLDACALRGAVYYGAEQWDAALADFNFVLSHRPTDAQSLLGRGVINLKKDRLKSAERDFRSFLRLRPDDPMAPQLRKLIASLTREQTAASEENTTDQSNSQNETGANPATSGSRRVSADSERMAEELFLKSHQLSDAYSRKVLRGEHAEAVGDIHTDQSTPATDATSGQGVQIIEPH
jgi:tetratricopeptide (TPR) repeat protein